MTDATTTPDKDGFVAKDFVFIGKALDDKMKVFVIIQPIEADGTLGKKMSYGFNRKRDKNVGGIYTGAMFDEAGTVRNLDGSRFQKLWPNQEERMVWQAKNEAVESELRGAKLEKDEGRISEIEKILLPIRQTYENMRFRHDWAGCEALEKAVLRALRSAPRVIE